MGVNNYSARTRVALVCLAFVLLTVFASFEISSTTKAYAVNSVNEYDSSDPLEDLRSDKNFNIAEYPFDGTGNIQKPSLINVVEYCYSYKANMQSNFGLYLYIYNPQGVKFNKKSNAHKAQMAVAYADGLPTDYEKFTLKYCSESKESNYYGLFWKFRVLDHESADGKTILKRVNSNARRYDISGIELQIEGENTAREYAVGATYTFTGYAKGYGPDIEAESNLTCDAQDFETVRLDVRNTFYRTGHSNAGVNHRNQLNTVYFGVDNSLLEKYGKLQRIKAEWYEYKTKPIIVTNVSEAYNAISPYVGQRMDPWNNGGLLYQLYLNKWSGDSSSYINRFDWAWNPETKGLDRSSPPSTLDYYLYYFFYNSSSDYDPYSEKVGSVAGNRLYEYMLGYNKTYNSGKLDVPGKDISADLFLDSVDSNRTKGYNVHEIDEADIELTKMLSYKSGDPSFWKKNKDFGFWKALFNDIPDADESILDLPPIYAVGDKDIVSGDTQATANNLTIREADASDFITYYNEAKSEDKTTFLFRFAVTDYYSAPIEIWRESNTWHGFDEKKWSNGGYYAQQSVFFNFDIISLTFNKEGKFTVLPVVSNPIDIVSSVDEPLFWQDENGKTTWWSWVLLAVVIIVLLVILIPLTPHFVAFIAWLLKSLFWLVSAPFKGIASAVKKRRSMPEKPKVKKEKKPKPSKAERKEIKALDKEVKEFERSEKKMKKKAENITVAELENMTDDEIVELSMYDEKFMREYYGEGEQ